MHLPIGLCCGMQMHCNYVLSYIISIPGMMYVSVPFSKLHEHAYPYSFSCGTKDCLQTNYGDINAVPSFMCCFNIPNMHLL